MSKNVTAIKNSCWRLFMVINVLALFQFQNLQILKLTVKQDQSSKRKTPTSETQQRRRKGRAHTAYFFTLASLLLFCKTNQSPPPWHSLQYWACASASQHSSRSATLPSGSVSSPAVRNTNLWPFPITSALLWGDHLWYNRSGHSSVLPILLQKTVSLSISDTPEAAVLF